jgi:hypothetical protein
VEDTDMSPSKLMMQLMLAKRDVERARQSLHVGDPDIARERLEKAQRVADILSRVATRALAQAE